MKYIKHEICLLKIVASSEQCVMVLRATHMLDNHMSMSVTLTEANPTTAEHHLRHLQSISATTALESTRLQLSTSSLGKPHRCLVQLSILI